MALRPKVIYPAQINSADPNFPHGKARNRGTPGDGTGTPWEEKLVNEHFGFQQALLANAGITPNDLPETAAASQYLEAIAFFTKELNGVYPLQFPEVHRGMISTFNSFGPSYITSCLNTTDHYTAWIAWYDNAGRISRNRGFDAFDTIQGAFPSGALASTAAISGGQDGVLLTLDGTAGKTYASTDAGQSFAAAVNLPVAGPWQAINYSNELGLWLATGTTKAARSPGLPGMAWTASAVPGAMPITQRIIVPRIGESGHGALCLAQGAPSYFTLDGVTWQTLNLSNVEDACWSEYHKRWFFLWIGGELISCPVLSSSIPTTLEHTFWQSGSSFYKRIFPLGRFVVILGDYIADSANRTTGSVLVSDLTRHGAFTVDGGGHTHALEHDSRLVLMRGTPGQPLDVAGGMRSPWLL